MSILDSMMAKAVEAEAAALVFKFVENQGGVQAIVQKFEQQGLGDVAKSWVSTGVNQAITPEHIQQVFGSDTLKQMAAKVGVSPDMVAQGLAKLLPQVVDQATPDGAVTAKAS